MDSAPPPDPVKLLAHWMEWERGDTTPGTVLKNLKVGGMLELLQGLAGHRGDASGPAPGAGA